MALNEVPKASYTYEEFIGRYINLLLEDLKACYSYLELNENLSMSDVFAQAHQKYNQGFIFIIDEWDYIFNNNLFSKEDRENFLQFLKDLLKDNPPVELAYMTGVLPIAKYSSGSALNMFIEFNMLIIALILILGLHKVKSKHYVKNKKRLL